MPAQSTHRCRRIAHWQCSCGLQVQPGMLMLAKGIASFHALSPNRSSCLHSFRTAQVQPDMLMFAKGIASGFPFAGVSARPELYSKMSPGMMVS